MRPLSPKPAHLLATLWGFAEATLFFIVPDVLLSVLARHSLLQALRAALFATTGALLGGALLYGWALHDAASASAAIEAVPAVDAAMLARVRDELQQHGLLAVLLGPLSGTPYKVYALQAAQGGYGLAGFLLVSLPARLLRFAAVSAFCHYGLRLVQRYWPRLPGTALLAAGWVGFYLVYFWRMPG